MSVLILKKEKRSVELYDLFRTITRYELIFNIIGIITAIIAGLCSPLMPVILGRIIDAFSKWAANTPSNILITPQDLIAQVNSAALNFIWVFIVSFTCTGIYMFCYVYTSERQTNRIREHYLLAVLTQEIAWFDTVGPGEVASRIASDTLLIQDGIGEKVPLAVSQLSTFLFAFLIAMLESWQLTLVLVCIIPPMAGSLLFMNILSTRFQKRILNVYSVAGTIAEESLSYIRIITAYNAQSYMSDRYEKNLVASRKEGIKKTLTVGMGIGLFNLFIFMGYSLCFYYGWILLVKDEITPGRIVKVFFSVIIGSFALGSIAPDLEAFSLAKGAASKIFETIDRKPPIDVLNSEGKTMSVQGEITLKDVKFTYPSRPDVPVLKGMSLKIEKGSTVALVGQSGSGKSTIIQLLERFYDPDDGVIELDGVPLKELNLSWLRRQIGLVSQEPILFDASIYENIEFGLVGSEYEQADKEVKFKLIMDAAKEANAHTFISKLPQGYDTHVGERGFLLSGGEKQRIAIARAIVKNPKILLLDEATSALDTASERIVQEALDRVSQSRTTIMIAHRLSTIMNADNIVVMVAGSIIESGTHETLLRKNGFYAQLTKAQQLQISTNHTSREIQLEQSEMTPITFNVKDEETACVELIKYSWMGVLKRMLFYNRPEYPLLLVALVASLVSGAVYPVFAIFFSTILNLFAQQGPSLEKDAKFWSLNFVYLALGAGCLNFTSNFLFGVSGEFLTQRLRASLFSAFLFKDVAFFDIDKHSTGILTSNLSTDAQQVQGASGVTLGALVQISATILGGIIVSFIYGWKLALVAVACLPFLVLAGGIRSMVHSYFHSKHRSAYEKSAKLASEAVTAIKTVQSLTREKQVHSMYLKYLEEPTKDGFKSAWTGALWFAASQAIPFLIDAVMFFYGVQLVAYSGYGIPQVFTVFVAIVSGSNGTGRIFGLAPNIAKAKGSGQAIIDILDEKSLIDVKSDQGQKPTIQGHIEFKQVVFHYPTRPSITVLKGLNIKVEPGQFVALVGPSGCGKSTTIGLLERFYDVNGGQILIDGIPLNELNVSHYRDFVGLVSQEPNLFDLTIEENIAFGRDLSLEKIIEAAKNANIHDFIMSLPDGYKTRLGQKGSQLSGGQRQRISIARALVTDPKILLLDEATSALDAESERLIQETLDKAAKGRTTIAIAHRLSTIQHADVIYVLKDGVVQEAGNHSALLNQKGLYHELVLQQNLE